LFHACRAFFSWRQSHKTPMWFHPDYNHINHTNPLKRKRKVLDSLQRERYIIHKNLPINSYSHSYPIKAISFIPKCHDVKVICADMKGIVYMYNPSDPVIPFQQMFHNNSHTSVNRMLVNDRNECCFGNDDFSLQVYDLEKKISKFQGYSHNSFITDMKYMDGFYLTSSLDGTCNIWHSCLQRSVFTLPVENSNVHSCAFVPDKPYQIITASEKHSTVYGSSSQVKLWDIRFHPTYVTQILKSEHRDSLSTLWSKDPVDVSYYDESEEEGEDIGLWGSSWSQGSSSKKPKATPQKMEQATFVPSAYTLKEKYVFNKLNGQYRGAIQDHDASKRIYHVSCTQSQLLTSSLDSTHKLWDIKDQKPMASFGGCKKDDFTMPTPVFIRDFEQLVCGDIAGHIYIWNTYRTSNEYTTNHAYKFRAHFNSITAIAANELGDAIASCDNHGFINIVSLIDHDLDISKNEEKLSIEINIEDDTNCQHVSDYSQSTSFEVVKRGLGKRISIQHKTKGIEPRTKAKKHNDSKTTKKN
jgi:hypothetical protein